MIWTLNSYSVSAVLLSIFSDDASEVLEVSIGAGAGHCIKSIIPQASRSALRWY